jgi:hypothetical protein
VGEIIIECTKIEREGEGRRERGREREREGGEEVQMIQKGWGGEGEGGRANEKSDFLFSSPFF